MNEDTLPGATVSGIDPDTGDAYTIPAGEAYTSPKGLVIDSAGFSDAPAEVQTDDVETVDEQKDTPLIVAPATPPPAISPQSSIASPPLTSPSVGTPAVKPPSAKSE